MLTEMSTGLGAGAAIRTTGLVKSFGKQTAVDGVSLEIPEGSVFGLLGENGAGKSTTLQMIVGLQAPDGGTVRTLGLDPARFGVEVRRLIGYLPEQPVYHDWMTVGEIGWFAAGFQRATGPSRFQARYEELTAGFQLPTKKRLRHLSKGMRAKVGLAMALAADPALLVLDEPTSGLDLMVRREFLESMIDLAGSGRTVLLSSHQIAEVERVASHVALMHKGKLLLAEPLESLRRRSFIVELNASGGRPPWLASGPGLQVIDAEEATRQARWLVHADDRGVVESLRRTPGVESLTITTPTLEEIYIGYMRGRNRAGSATPTAYQVA